VQFILDQSHLLIARERDRTINFCNVLECKSSEITADDRVIKQLSTFLSPSVNFQPYSPHLLRIMKEHCHHLLRDSGLEPMAGERLSDMIWKQQALRWCHKRLFRKLRLGSNGVNVACTAPSTIPKPPDKTINCFRSTALLNVNLRFHLITLVNPLLFKGTYRSSLQELQSID
jgi:hypothetical protein